MDEMTMLREAGTLLDPPTAEAPEALRARVLDELTADADVPTLALVGAGVGAGVRGAGRVPGRAPRPGRDRWSHRFAGRAAVAAGVAAVAAGALAIVPTLGQDPAASAGAVEILESAAARAAQETPWDPRPDQFVYSRGIERVTHEGEGPDGEYVTALVTSTRETWTSVDGRHPGLTQGVAEPGQDPWAPEGGPWETPLEPCDGTWTACANVPAFPEGMPTDGDPQEMLDFLRAAVAPYETSAGDPEPVPDQEVFDEAVRLLQGGGMPPQIRSGLLGAVALIPGVTDGGTLTDVAGRTGVGVGLTSAGGTRTDLVIDPETDEVLGTRTDDGSEAGPTGWALLGSGVVDAVGETP